MTDQWRSEVQGIKWSGSGELWLDPQGNNVDLYDCTLSIEADVLHYTWLYKGQSNSGSFTFNGSGATWIDTWHQPTPATCQDVTAAWGLFTVEHEYRVPSNPNWGWRSKLSKRPNGDLVLQMTNIAPWGEEGRAVRMVFTPVQDKA